MSRYSRAKYFISAKNVQPGDRLEQPAEQTTTNRKHVM
jgi:hypothetical protein